MLALTARGVLALCLLLLAGCTPDELEPEAARAARELFAATPSEQRLSELFGPSESDSARAKLLDALAQLASAGEPGDVQITELSGPDEVVADVEVGLAGAGSAVYSVHLERHAADSWRVREFHGPGVDWPPPRSRRDDGLSVQPAPI